MASKDLNKEVEEFNNFYHKNIKELENACESYKSLINSLINTQFTIQGITSRVKDRDECINKFKEKYFKTLEEAGVDFSIKDHITDLLGLRVVCLYQEDIPLIQDVLSHNFEVKGVTDKIKILDDTEDQFGYKSLHIDLKLNSSRSNLPEYKNLADLAFEVQIRTIIQDAWSVLDHKIKYKKNIPPDLKRRINRLAALFEIADDEFFSIKVGTQDFEKSTETKPHDPLNVISFLSFVEKNFTGYEFLSYKADWFVHELLKLHSTFSQEELEKSMQNHLDIVRKYNSELRANLFPSNLNPYTMIRHCLYLSNAEKFSDLLFEIQRRSFDAWLEEQTKGDTK